MDELVVVREGVKGERKGERQRKWEGNKMEGGRDGERKK